MLTNRIHVDIGCIDQDNNYFAGIILIDIIHTRTGATDKFQLCTQIKHFSINQKFGTYHQALVIAEDSVGFIRFDSWPIIAGIAHSLCLFNKNGVYIVDDEDVFHFKSNINIYSSSGHAEKPKKKTKKSPCPVLNRKVNFVC